MLRSYNFTSSCRGAIRRAPNALSFVFGSHAIGDPDFVKTWNSTAPSAGKIVGRKALCVRQLLELPAKELGSVYQLVSEFGWEGQ